MKHSDQEFYARMAFKYLDKFATLRHKIQLNPKWEKRKMGNRVLEKYMQNHIYWDVLLYQNMMMFGRLDKTMAVLTSLALTKLKLNKN